MYISTNPGLGARRRRGMGALNCPGDPGCPGYMPPEANALLLGEEQTAADFQTAVEWFRTNATPNLAKPGQTAASPSKQWIAGVSNTVVGIGAAAIAGLMFMKAMR